MSTSSGSRAEQSLADRYGAPSPGRRLGGLLAIGGVAVAFLGWVVWATLGHESPGYGAQLHSYVVLSEHRVRVWLDAHRTTDRSFACTLTAQAEDHSVVGETRVPVPAGAAGDLKLRASIKTDRRATTAVVSECH